MADGVCACVLLSLWIGLVEEVMERVLVKPEHSQSSHFESKGSALVSFFGR